MALENAGRSEPTSTTGEMTAWLAADLGIPTEKLHAWTVILALDMEEGVGLTLRVSDAQPDPYLILGEIEALCKAVTDSENPPEDSGQG